MTVDLWGPVVICLFPLKLKRSPLWSSVRNADIEANCAKNVVVTVYTEGAGARFVADSVM